MSFSKRTMRPRDWDAIKNFKSSEFKYPALMGYEFMIWLDSVATDADVTMVVSSSHRPAAYNKSVGGAKNSAHVDVPCDAVDITPKSSFARFRIVKAALEKGCKRIGLYKNGSIHLDMTHDRRPSHVLWNVVSNPA
jgi:uncharacterized protein YcbK (DUF882 family)